MTLYDLSSVNSSTIASTYSGISASVNWIFPTILLFEFIIIMITGIYSQNRRVGYSNIPMWGTISSLVTTFTCFLLSAVSGIIQFQYILINISVFGIFLAWFFLTDLE